MRWLTFGAMLALSSCIGSAPVTEIRYEDLVGPVTLAQCPQRPDTPEPALMVPYTACLERAIEDHNEAHETAY